MKELDVAKDNETPATHSFFFIKEEENLEKVNIHEVLFIHSVGHQCFIQTPLKRYSVVVPLSKLLLKFKQHGFYKCHRNYIIQLRTIESFDLNSNEILLRGFTIPVSKRHRRLLLPHINLLS